MRRAPSWANSRRSAFPAQEGPLPLSRKRARSRPRRSETSPSTLAVIVGAVIVRQARLVIARILASPLRLANRQVGAHGRAGVAHAAAIRVGADHAAEAD